MTPTVTIDLNEYEQLRKLRDCFNQKKSYIVYKAGYGATAYLFVDDDDTTKKLEEEMQKLRKDRDYWHDKYTKTLATPITIETKKWYQFWK